jgi:hypothetical protein
MSSAGAFGINLNSWGCARAMLASVTAGKKQMDKLILIESIQKQWFMCGAVCLQITASICGFNSKLS